jgi:predicted GIY-YIG superfamily endonuclease
MDDKIKMLSRKYDNLIISDMVSFDAVVSLNNIMGVYIIYNDKNEALYIGSTNKFHVRFGTDLKHEATHTLVRKLISKGYFKNRHEVVDYLKSQCKIRIEKCVTKREAEALEHVAIYILNPILNK